MDFYTSCTSENRNEYSTEELQNVPLQPNCVSTLHDTRKLSYHKHDRAMRPNMGDLKNFESLSTPTATFPEICNGLLFRSILRMCVQNLKFVPLPVPGITGGIQKKLDSPWIRPRSFSPKFLMGLCSDDLPECTGQI